MISIKKNNIGWNFDNTYCKLSPLLFTKINPTIVKKPKLVILNKNLATYLNLNLSLNNDEYLSSLFAGNILPKGSNCIAQAYAGHQFGHFTMLGDGRAILIGEHVTKANERFDIQLKGSGITIYSRNGDGRAGLGTMLREYLISEAMYGLNIPTSRSLAVVKTGENIIREEILEGAVLTRIASSHIRIGTFQYTAMKNDIGTLSKLVNYTLNRHYLENMKEENEAENLLKILIDKQISLVINWMRVGFIHGVMNTDNVSLSGETIDYGPCAFMNYYDPKTVFSSIDHQGRYSFENQEIICHWNLSRFAETLLPLFSNNQKKSIDIGKKIIDEFSYKFKKQWLSMMKKKLGFIGSCKKDENFIARLLNWMEKNKADYTNTFIFFMNKSKIESDIYKKDSFISLYKEWENRIQKNLSSKEISFNLMKTNNPVYIPRNHFVEDAIYEATNKNDYTKFNNLLKLIKKPYEEKKDCKSYLYPSSLNDNYKYKTYCGT